MSLFHTWHHVKWDRDVGSLKGMQWHKSDFLQNALLNEFALVGYNVMCFSSVFSSII